MLVNDTAIPLLFHDCHPSPPLSPLTPDTQTRRTPRQSWPVSPVAPSSLGGQATAGARRRDGWLWGLPPRPMASIPPLWTGDPRIHGASLTWLAGATPAN